MASTSSSYAMKPHAQESIAPNVKSKKTPPKPSELALSAVNDVIEVVHELFGTTRDKDISGPFQLTIYVCFEHPVSSQTSHGRTSSRKHKLAEKIHVKDNC